jgi:hypothetical protein
MFTPLLGKEYLFAYRLCTIRSLIEGMSYYICASYLISRS